MPTYAEYCQHANAKGFQPLNEKAFNSLILVKFNPITNMFIKEAI